MAHEIQRMLPRHYSILELVLDGFGPKEIAEVVGMSKEGVGQVIMAPIFQNELANRRQKQTRAFEDNRVKDVSAAKKRLEELAIEAVETHAELMGPDHKPEVRQRSADAVLSKVYPRGIDGSGGENSPLAGVTIITLGDLKSLQVALRESGRAPVDGAIVDSCSEELSGAPKDAEAA